jgi:predicted PurR-regulated permease PerM
LAESEIEQDAQEAAAMETEPSPPAYMRTPRWVWVWALPLVIILLLYMARKILPPFILAGVLAYIFSMVVDRIENRLRWPRWVIVTLLYAAVLGTIGVGLYFGAEALYRQTRDFIVQGPNIVERGLQQVLGNATYTFGGTVVNAHFLAERINEAITGFFGSAGDAVHIAGEIITWILDTLLVIVVSFYLLLHGKKIGPYLLKFVPEGSRARTGYVAERIHAVLGAYLRGQLFLIVIMSIASFVVLQFIFHVPYALPLAIMTGFLEILPLAGPAIAAVIAAGVALSAHGAGEAIGVIIAYTILREVEDQLVMPIVVGKAVELHPVATIFAVLAGGAIAGVMGMLLAVPVAAAIKVILDFLYPTTPEKALAQARPGMRKAEKEAEARGEEAAPVGARD